MFISLLTDFGTDQEYAGVCKAVMLSIAPAAKIVDISHTVPSYDIEEGALMLKNFVQYSPVGVHVVVVDPGVGTQRRGIAIQTERGDVLVGPDNGVLIEAADLLGVSQVIALENRKYMLESVSSSFHGRDIFAPVAAYLAHGVPVEEFGTRLDKDELKIVRVPRPTENEEAIYGTVLRLDRFGNIQLNIKADMIPETPKVTLKIRGEKLTLPFVKTFGEVGSKEFLLYEDSDGLLTISQNQGNAANLLNIEKKMKVFICKEQQSGSRGISKK
jgi:S-adenosylmethionine hydrolase